MADIWSVLMFLGASVCHQLPERSYFFGDLQMPLCARCIGIHFGFLLSALLLVVGPRRYCSKLLSPRQVAILGALMVFFFLDSGLSYADISASDNMRRTLSGLALGIPLPFLLIPLINMFAFPGRNGSGPIGNKADWLWLPGLYALGAGSILIAEDSEFLFYLVSILGIIGLFGFFSANISAIALLVSQKSAVPARTKLLVSVICVIIALLLVAGARELLAG